MKKLALLAALLPLLLVVAVVVGFSGDQLDTSACSVPGISGRNGRLDPAQVGNARIIVGVAGELRLPPRAAVVAVATAKQESDLRNLPYGDRDSLGLFQQRPSQGWGTRQQLLNPIYASAKFYDHLVQVPGWKLLPLTVAAQLVQRSAFPNAYARWEPLATRLVSAITGRDTSAMACRVSDEGAAADASGPSPYPAQSMGPDGLTPRAREAMAEVMRAFGVTDVGGFCPGGCRTGHGPNSDHYTGHAVDYMLLPMNAANHELGNRIAAWLVANHQRLGVKYVIWYDHIWSAARAAEGWRPYTSPYGDAHNLTLRHHDHVHLSVY